MLGKMLFAVAVALICIVIAAKTISKAKKYYALYSRKKKKRKRNR